MKIGILTHHWLPNFGANLQAYCTVQALRDLGCEPVMIDYRLDAIRDFYAERVDPAQLAKHEDFVCGFLPQGPVVGNSSEVIEFARETGLEGVVSGSDAVLRLDLSRPGRPDLQFPNPFWLDWAGAANISRTGFLAASSMGSNFLELRRGLRRSIGEATCSLSHCSVRDSWTRRMLGICGVDSDKISWSPDPVSYLPSMDLDGLLPDIEVPDRPFVLVSLYPQSASPEWVAQLVKELDSHGLAAVGFPHPDYPVPDFFDYKVDLPLDPLTWLSWLRACDGYIGVRFHPVMLSLVFGKPFVAIDHYDLGIPFRNPVFSKAGRLMAPISRRVSKTFDLCHRAGRQRYVLPARRMKHYRPAGVVDLLLEHMTESERGGHREAWAGEFRSQLKKIIGQPLSD